MKLLLRRDQRSGFTGGITFSLDVRADLSDEERRNITKYKLGKTVLYSKEEIVDRGSGLLGLASLVAFKAMNISISVDDLVGGKRVDCKDIVEMLAVENQIKEAGTTFGFVLSAASSFGGEEVVEL